MMIIPVPAFTQEVRQRRGSMKTQVLKRFQRKYIIMTMAVAMKVSKLCQGLANWNPLPGCLGLEKMFAGKVKFSFA